MHSKIKTLRTRGQRKADRDILSSDSIEGDLTLAFCAGSPDLSLHPHNDSTGTTLVPTLHEARLISMHSFKMLFRGIERDEKGAEYVQEWSVQIGR